nr:hypothetical protein [Salinispora pacifica]
MTRPPGRMLLAAIAGFAVALGFPGVAQADVAARQIQGDASSQPQDVWTEYWEGANLVGIGKFNADRDGSIPEDSIQACDYYGDGWWVEVRMDVDPTETWETDRFATTQGNAPPYCSPWESGSLVEGTPVAVKVCKVKDAEEYCEDPVLGRA